jgi:hypothetical protein
MRGFIQIQNLMERSLISIINEKNKGTSNSQLFNENEIPVAYLKQFPYPKYKREE